MNYELKHFDTTLLRFSATEDSNTPEIKILSLDENKKHLLPLKGASNTGREPYSEYYAAQIAKALYDMFVLEAVICNTDRHLGNFRFFIDSKTNGIIAPAPLFDHGNALFNHAGEDDFASEETLSAYAETLLPCVYDDFIGTAKAVLTPEHKEGLRKLLNFRFKRHSRYNLPSKHLTLIEKQVRERARRLLEK